jgi:hypothetical protein
MRDISVQLIQEKGWQVKTGEIQKPKVKFAELKLPKDWL